jgi:hypothetical protein
MICVDTILIENGASQHRIINWQLYNLARLAGITTSVENLAIALVNVLSQKFTLFMSYQFSLCGILSIPRWEIRFLIHSIL